MSKNEEVKVKDVKAGEAFSKFMNKATDMSRKAAANVQEKAKTLSEKIKSDNQDKRKKKLNPLFPEELTSEHFHVPNIIKIVDDAVRRNEILCEGAVGWRDMENKTEVLYLYDEAEELSGLQFIPSFECNSVYCVDPFDRRRFIKADCIFSKAQEEKLAELENIAYCLGAVSCSIEIQSSDKSQKAEQKSFSLGFGQNGSVVQASMSAGQGNLSNGKTTVTFAGHDHPTVPHLKWFRHDDTIKNLIEMRCKDPASVKSRTLYLLGASSASMNLQTAVTIDVLVKEVSGKQNGKMEVQSTREQNSQLVFEVQF